MFCRTIYFSLLDIKGVFAPLRMRNQVRLVALTPEWQGVTNMRGQRGKLTPLLTFLLSIEMIIIPWRSLAVELKRKPGRLLLWSRISE